MNAARNRRKSFIRSLVLHLIVISALYFIYFGMGMDQNGVLIYINRFIQYRYKKEFKLFLTGTINKFPNDHIIYKYKFNYPPTSENITYHITYKDRSITNYYNSGGRIINTHFYVLERLYINSLGGIAFSKYYYFNNKDEISLESHRNLVKSLNLVNHYLELVVVGYGYCRINYGHCFEDFYTPLFMIPEDIRTTSLVLVLSLPSIADELLNIFGVSKENRVYIPDNSWAYVDKVYTIADRVHFLCNYGMPVLLMKRFFHEKFNLSAIKPTRYCYTNRGYYRPRYIHNLDELVKNLKSNFPDVHWEFVSDNHSSVCECARDWKSILFIFCPIGSNTAKIIFMEDNSVCVATTTGRPEWYISQLCVACNIFEVQYDGMTGDHLTGHGSPVDINLTIKMISCGFYVLKHGKWPQSEMF